MNNNKREREITAVRIVLKYEQIFYEIDEIVFCSIENQMYGFVLFMLRYLHDHFHDLSGEYVRILRR